MNNTCNNLFIISLFVLLIFMISVCSCDNDNSGVNIDQSGENNIKPIDFYHYFEDSISGGITETVNQYNKNSNKFRINSTPLDHEAFKTSIIKDIAGNNSPDIFSYWAGAKTKALVDQGLVVNIDDIWKDMEIGKHFSQSIINSACVYNGKKYLLPITQHFVAIFYNKNIFDKYSLKVPENWDEFSELCRKLSSKNITPISLGSKEKWPAQFWFDYILLRTAGNTYRNRLMVGGAEYTDKEVNHAFYLWKELIDNGFFNTSPNEIDWEEAAKMVFRGETAMTLMGTWIIGFFNDSKHDMNKIPDIDYFIFPIINKDIKLTSLGPIDGMLISKNSNDIKSTADFLQYMSTTEAQKLMSRGSGALSPNIQIRPDFYSNIQKRIRDDIDKSELWAFNYDLATDPDIAEIGLKALSEFIEFPDLYKEILIGIEQKKRKITDNP